MAARRNSNSKAQAGTVDHAVEVVGGYQSTKARALSGTFVRLGLVLAEVRQPVMAFDTAQAANDDQVALVEAWRAQGLTGQYVGANLATGALVSSNAWRACYAAMRAWSNPNLAHRVALDAKVDGATLAQVGSGDVDAVRLSGDDAKAYVAGLVEAKAQADAEAEARQAEADAQAAKAAKAEAAKVARAQARRDAKGAGEAKAPRKPRQAKAAPVEVEAPEVEAE